MIKYIREMCEKHNCTVTLTFDSDNCLSISVYGKHNKYLLIRADWSDDTIKKCIDDAVRGACND